MVLYQAPQRRESRVPHRDECIHRYKALLKAEIKQLPHHIHALYSRGRFLSQKAPMMATSTKANDNYSSDPNFTTIRTHSGPRRSYNSQPLGVKPIASAWYQASEANSYSLASPLFTHPEVSDCT